MPQFTFSVTEQLIPNQDFTDKKKQLRTHVDNMRADDDEFYVLVNNIIVGEDQKGKIIDAMKKETTARKDRDESIYADITSKISKAVNSFNEQVADMKKQRLSVTYEDKTE